jgi:anti-sigma B factor antagonist
MTTFEVETEVLADGTQVVSVTGELDVRTAPRFERALAVAIVSAPAAVVVDLSDCEFLDSSALTVLVKANNHLDGSGPGFSLVIPHQHLLKVFEITRLDQVFTIHATRAALSNAGTAPDR